MAMNYLSKIKEQSMFTAQDGFHSWIRICTCKSPNHHPIYKLHNTDFSHQWCHKNTNNTWGRVKCNITTKRFCCQERMGLNPGCYKQETNSMPNFLQSSDKFHQHELQVHRQHPVVSCVSAHRIHKQALQQ